jgi:hypothetical protein
MAKPGQKTLKATFTLGAELVTRINACASLRGQSRDAFATAALEVACKGLVLFDKGKKTARSEGTDRQAQAKGVNPDDKKDAA